MKFIYLFICFMGSSAVLEAQQAFGVFGKTNLIGMNLDIQPFRMNKYTRGRLVVPLLQYSKVLNRNRTLTYEIGYFNIGIKDNENRANNAFRIDVDPKQYKQPEIRILTRGNGRFNGILLGFYRTAANWVGLSPLGSYHSWGLQLASVGNGKSDYQFRYINKANQSIDTFFNDGDPPRKLLISFSLAFGGKVPIKKSKRTLWDYGIKLKLPLIGGFYKDRDTFDTDRKFLMYNGVRSYKHESVIMIYTGIHFAF